MGFIAAGTMIVLMSWAVQETDTTTFQSEQPRPMTDTTPDMHGTDSNNTRIPAPNGAPASSLESRRTTPGVSKGDSIRKR